MNGFKKFLVRNRHLVALTTSVSLAFVVVFVVLGVLLLDRAGAATNTSENRTEKNESNNKDNDKNIQTSQQPSHSESSETTSRNENIIDVIEEETSERETVDTNELPYLIMVNRAMNCVTVYTKDETGQFTVPVKAFVCSTGREGHETPLGTYTTSDMFRWAVMADGTRAQYVYRFKNSYLFHSVPYLSTSKDSLETEEFNKLGEAASLGCVRLCVRDAIWIYENCAVNTTVILYDDVSSPGPLGKPEMIKIPVDSPYAGWDPTDPDDANPWKQFKAEIKGNSNNISVSAGSNVNTVLSYFVATDTCGNDISDKMTIEGNYNLAIPGVYTVKAKVVDAIGSEAEMDFVLNVTEVPTEEVPESTTTVPQPTNSTLESTTTTNTTDTSAGTTTNTVAGTTNTSNITTSTTEAFESITNSTQDTNESDNGV